MLTGQESEKVSLQVQLYKQKLKTQSFILFHATVYKVIPLLLSLSCSLGQLLSPLVPMCVQNETTVVSALGQWLMSQGLIFSILLNTAQ